MKILALDLSSNTGYALGRTDSSPSFGTVRLPSTGEEIGPFAKAFDGWLRGMIALEHPDRIVFEAPILSAGRTSIATARKLLGLAYHTELICSDLGIACREGNLMTVKAFFAGTGRADKAAMIAAAHRYGWIVRNDNEADACGLWAYSVHQIAPQHAARFGMSLMGARA